MNHPEPHDLTALAYGLVGGDERTRLLEHVHLCDDCRALYDSYQEEQALVRDSLYRDARSGPAEARALERALQTLNGAPEPVVSTFRVFRLVTWQFVGKAAAVIAVALGLLIVLTPRPDENEPVIIARENQAPASVVSGSLMVPMATQWRPADAVPAQEWVMSGGSEPLVLAFDDGARFTARPGTVFRVVDATAWDQPSVCVLHGAGEFKAANENYGITLLSGEGEFVPLARSVVAYSAVFNDAPQWRPDAISLRAYQMPQSLQVRLRSGRGVYLPSKPGVMPGVLSDGQRLFCNPYRQEVSGNNQETFDLVMVRSDMMDWRVHAELQRKNLGQWVNTVRSTESALDQKLMHRLLYQVELAQLHEVPSSNDAVSVAPHASNVDLEVRVAAQEPEIAAEINERFEKTGTLCERSADGTLELYVNRDSDGSLSALVVRPDKPLAQPIPLFADNLGELFRSLPMDAAKLLMAKPKPLAAAGSTGKSGGLSPAPRQPARAAETKARAGTR